MGNYTGLRADLSCWHHLAPHAPTTMVRIPLPLLTRLTARCLTPAYSAAPSRVRALAATPPPLRVRSAPSRLPSSPADVGQLPGSASRVLRLSSDIRTALQQRRVLALHILPQVVRRAELSSDRGRRPLDPPKHCWNYTAPCTVEEEARRSDGTCGYTSVESSRCRRCGRDGNASSVGGDARWGSLTAHASSPRQCVCPFILPNGPLTSSSSLFLHIQGGHSLSMPSIRAACASRPWRALVALADATPRVCALLCARTR